MVDNTEFLKRLFDLTGAKTKAELARAIGSSKSKVGDWARGRYAPTLRVLERIKERTGHDLREFVHLNVAQEATAPGEDKPVRDIQPAYDDPFLTACRTILKGGSDQLVYGFLVNIWGLLAQVDGQEAEAIRLRDLVSGYVKRRKRGLLKAG